MTYQSMRRTCLKDMFKIAKCIGVERAMDLATKGDGTVVFEEPTVVHGINSKFKS